MTDLQDKWFTKVEELELHRLSLDPDSIVRLETELRELEANLVEVK